MFFTIFAEFGRALAAARRYENLRYGRACRDGLGPADIPRRESSRSSTRQEAKPGKPRAHATRVASFVSASASESNVHATETPNRRCQRTAVGRARQRLGQHPGGHVRPVYEAVLERTRVTTGTRYLDVGCGAGMAAQIAAARGAQVSGIDAAEALLAIARRRTPTGDFRQGDLEELPFDDRQLRRGHGLQFVPVRRQSRRGAGRGATRDPARRHCRHHDLGRSRRHGGGIAGDRACVR